MKELAKSNLRAAQYLSVISGCVDFSMFANPYKPERQLKPFQVEKGVQQAFKDGLDESRVTGALMTIYMGYRLSVGDNLKDFMPAVLFIAVAQSALQQLLVQGGISPPLAVLSAMLVMSLILQALDCAMKIYEHIFPEENTAVGVARPGGR